jgi:superfamily II DNA or RNA helicase
LQKRAGAGLALTSCKKRQTETLLPNACKAAKSSDVDSDIQFTSEVPRVAAEHRTLNATYNIAIAALPLGWQRADWFLETTVKPLANPSCPVKPAPIVTAQISADGKTLQFPRFLGMRCFGAPTTSLLTAPVHATATALPADLAKPNPAIHPFFCPAPSRVAPRSTLGHDRDSDCVRDDRSLGLDLSDAPSTAPLVFGARLKQIQVSACQSALLQLRSSVGGAMLVLPCGFGKTVCALWLSFTLSRKTVVLVHSEALADQWQERVSTFLPGCTVGRIQRDTVNVDGCAIVVCMIQSLVKRSYAPDLLSSFGLVIVDEAHHVAAPMFSKALAKLPARYVLGLSATPDRSDGLGRVLPWFMGPIAFRTQREAEQVDVRILTFTRGIEKEVLNRKGDAMCSVMVTNIASEGLRTVWVKELVGEQICAGRNIMVLSDRLDQLGVLKEMLVEDHPDVVIAQVVGGTKAAERDMGFERARVILSTYHYASEGIDIPRLDTLILATPRGTIEQSVGRILRPFANKQRPLVIDIKDPFSMFQGMSWKRHKYYKSQQYNISFANDVENDQESA